ncbi:MAG TPA: LysM peptidoglycan-binding domain-containing protein [Candidatus Saccharimonadales bacterium]|nr:LysM peptidoglycan-binding domain-containing protein [Candidatus Saccharimonadales bacterium]
MLDTRDQKQRTTNTTTQTTLERNSSFFSRIRWGESYVSLLLGALVVIVAAFLGVFYVKVHQPKQELLPPATITRNIKLTITPSVSLTPLAKAKITPVEKTQNMKERIYVVQKNDNLWDISQKEYGSGYNWISIAHVNHLANPGMVFSGDKLIIPSVSPIIVQNKTEQILPTISSTRKMTPTLLPKPTATVIPTVKPKQTITQTPMITGKTYTVKPGDSLWTIALGAYNNGDKWVDIAKANKLTNPSLIHSGNVLKIPRMQTL